MPLNKSGTTILFQAGCFVALAFLLGATNAQAEVRCAKWGVKYTYTCIEWYPNGVDCKRSHKTSESVCEDWEDTFDVHVSGPIAPHLKMHGSARPASSSAGARCPVLKREGRTTRSYKCPSQCQYIVCDEWNFNPTPPWNMVCKKSHVECDCCGTE